MTTFFLKSDQSRVRFFDTLIIVFAVSLPIYPQVALAILAILGAMHLRLRPTMPRLLMVALVLFTATRMLHWGRLGQSPIMGLLEGGVSVLLWFGAKAFQKRLNTRILAIGILIGVCVSVTVAFVSALTPEWNVNKAKKSIAMFGVSRFEPVDSVDDYVSRVFDIRAAGQTTFAVKLRANKEYSLKLLVNSEALPKIFAEPANCNVKTEWLICMITVDMPKAAVVNFFVGGNASWKKGDPILEISQSWLVNGIEANVVERIGTMPRFSG